MQFVHAIRHYVGCDAGYTSSNMHPENGEHRVGKKRYRQEPFLRRRSPPCEDDAASTECHRERGAECKVVHEAFFGGGGDRDANTEAEEMEGH